MNTRGKPEVSSACNSSYQLSSSLHSIYNTLAITWTYRFETLYLEGIGSKLKNNLEMKGAVLNEHFKENKFF